MEFTYHDASKMIDHALLAPTLDRDALESGCRMAAAYDVASICIMPYYLKRCTEILDGTTVLPSTVIGFPHGGQATQTKIAESKQAIADGAVELDMVSNISAVLSGRWDYVRDEIAAIVDLTHEAGQKVKVIFENCYLQDDHKKKLCEISLCSRRGLGQNVDRIRNRWCDDGRPETDGRTHDTANPGQSCRRSTRFGNAAEGQRTGCHASRSQRDGCDPGSSRRATGDGADQVGRWIGNQQLLATQLRCLSAFWP